MARTVSYWKGVILSAITDTPELVTLDSTSKVSIYGLFAHCVAFCAYTLDVLFDTHKADVEKALTVLKPHRESWYREKALSFRYGYSLITDSDEYDNTGLTDDQIEAAQIVKYAAVVQAENESRLVIKVAREVDGELAPLSTDQYNAFVAYMAEVKDAGVFLSIINTQADKLFITARIFYDPLIIDSNGSNILAGGKPVEDALNEYMKELPFNGELILMNLVDKLQKVDGIKIPQIDAVSASAIDPELGDYGDAVFIDVKRKPEAGYFKIENFDNITYVPYV